jgi:MarR family transcriptional regulator, transcriptional regulator for hemolysin
MPAKSTKPAAAPRNEIGRQISQIARAWRRAVDRNLQPFGLTEATWLPLLRVARAAAPMRQKDLAAALSLDGSSVVRLLDELEAAGLIERREDEGDRRAKSIVLTARGRALVVKVERSARKVRREALRELSDAELALLSEALARIARALAPDGLDESAR